MQAFIAFPWLVEKRPCITQWAHNEKYYSLLIGQFTETGNEDHKKRMCMICSCGNNDAYGDQWYVAVSREREQ